jgi:hypothetical protein
MSVRASKVLRHTAGSAAVTATQPTIVGALAFTFAGLVATLIPLQVPWLPLLAPLTLLTSYAIVTQPFTGRPNRCRRRRIRHRLEKLQCAEVTPL